MKKLAFLTTLNQLRILNVTIYVFLWVLIFTACNLPKEENEHQRSSLLSPSDEIITLTLDSVSLHYGTAPQVFEDRATDSLYLVVRNQLLKSIDFYHLPMGRLSKRIIPEETGPNGTGELTGFQVINSDTILVISHFEFSVSFIDWDAKLIDRLYAPSKKVNLRVDGHKHAVVKDSILYLPFEDFNEYSVTKGFTKNIRTLYKVNLISRKFTPLIGYPSVYKDELASIHFIKKYSVINPYPNRDLLIISYPLDPNLVVVENDMASTSRPAYVTNADPVTAVDFDLMPPSGKHFNHLLSNLSYGHIAFDNINKVYYRLAWHPAKELQLVAKDYDERFKNVTSQRPFSIIVLNEALERLGEQKFDPPHNFDPNNLFVLNGGLHIYEKTDNPDEMRYRVFRLLNDDPTS